MHIRTSLVFASALLTAAACAGQTTQTITAAKPVAIARFGVVSGQFSMEGSLVKGQPYMADAVTETTQTLADGNRIDRKETTTVARDSEGRTHREQVFYGPDSSSSSSEQKIVFINDPVAKVNYVLEPNHTARKMPMLGMPPLPPASAGARAGSFTAIAPRPGVIAGPTLAVRSSTFLIGSGKPMFADNNKVKTEQLGKQTIEGVQAEGTRTTMTIPAGQIGNEEPIEIVSERWYSPELQVTVMTKTNDPRMGETTFQLMNIERTEPPASLFEVPSDYKIEEPQIIEKTVAPAN